MTFSELTLALLALLASPGPTNTLLFVAGAERGFARSLMLIAPVIAAYLATILPLSLIGAQLLERWPSARSTMMILAALWVLWLAFRLWQSKPTQDNNIPGVTNGSIAITTLLNPKALVFGLVLLPSPDRLAANTALFILLVAAISSLWAWAGATLAAKANGSGTLGNIRRLSAIWLTLVAAALILRGLGT